MTEDNEMKKAFEEATGPSVRDAIDNAMKNMMLDMNIRILDHMTDPESDPHSGNSEYERIRAAFAMPELDAVNRAIADSVKASVEQMNREMKNKDTDEH